ncbi:MAG TPA: ATP synthase F1 subunit delta [Thermoanaerobaculia bacterium]|nr:ATP synthase F1 subunit delta [Thermoanaerobaculia bacterium]
MASVSNQDLIVGRLYARSILELAEERGQAEELLEEMAEVVKQLDQSRELEEFLGSPLVEEESRAKVVEDLFRGRASDLLADALQVVNRKGRLGYLRAIAEAYRMEYRELRGWVDVQVRTAVPLTPELRTRLQDAIAAFTGRKPDLIERVEPSLLGGMVVEVAGKKIDASVASRLRDLSEKLLARASQEIHSGRAYVAES